MILSMHTLARSFGPTVVTVIELQLASSASTSMPVGFQEAQGADTGAGAVNDTRKSGRAGTPKEHN